MKKFLLTIRGLGPGPVAVTGSLLDCLHLAYYLHRCAPNVTCKMQSI